MKAQKEWYGVSNSQGGYLFSESYEALLRWKQIEGNIREPISEVTAEYERLKNHEFFMDFNDIITSKEK